MIYRTRVPSYIYYDKDQLMACLKRNKWLVINELKRSSATEEKRFLINFMERNNIKKESPVLTTQGISLVEVIDIINEYKVA